MSKTAQMPTFGNVKSIKVNGRNPAVKHKAECKVCHQTVPLKRDGTFKCHWIPSDVFTYEKMGLRGTCLNRVEKHSGANLADLVMLYSVDPRG
jgi:hypothetical protein